MFQKISFLCVFLWIAVSSFADSINATIEINGVTVNGGQVYVAVYSNETDHNNEIPFISFILESSSVNISHSLELPEGEYVVSVFQDRNNDGRLNDTIFGIPIEHIGITNYNRRGVPGNFNKLKVPVNNDASIITVNVGKVRTLCII